MKKFESVFKVAKPVVGMIHIGALPGTPQYAGSVNRIIDTAVKEAALYIRAGIDALAIENMHDVPYLKKEVGHEVSSLMGVIGYEIKKLNKVPCGIQILSSANKAALAVAKSAGLDFIRAEGFVFGHVADEGYVDACAGDLLRYRKNMDADHIAIFTDIKKKHSSHAITADVDIVETAKAAEFFLSDGLVVTGSATGVVADLEEIKAIKNKCKIPVLVGSGITFENIEKYIPVCDAMIVGSYFKKGGYWANELEYERIVVFMEKVNHLRN